MPRQCVADMAHARAYGAAVCTSDGRVLIMGGKATVGVGTRGELSMGFPVSPGTTYRASQLVSRVAEEVRCAERRGKGNWREIQERSDFDDDHMSSCLQIASL